MLKFRSSVAWRRIIVVLSDLLALCFSFIAAFYIRFDLSLGMEHVRLILTTLPYMLIAYSLTAQAFSLYRGIYYFSSFSDLLNITQASLSGGVLSAFLILFLRQGQFPRSVLILHPILAFLGICWVRFAIRIVKSSLKRRAGAIIDERDVLIVGAGDMGESLLRQILKTPDIGYNVVGFVDDDSSKFGLKIHGFPILGGRDKLGEIIRSYKIDEVIIAIAAKRGEIIRSVVDTLRNCDPKPELKVAPVLDEMLKPHGHGMMIRKVRPSDLLNRAVARLDESGITRSLERKTILVSGAGGTIGAELCRQALKYRPEKILLLESHATSLFYINEELRARGHGTAIVPILGDVRDSGLLERIFDAHAPQVILHAAAHKHVHQLEFNIPEGISNNILGTYHIAHMAAKHKVESFLLVSTDKAVRPCSVMGATKRAAERVVLELAQKSSTRFNIVRFGNVLGSSGSVLEIFQKQIANGGPITVTHPDVTRFFMTVQEAVGLILQAVSMAEGGEVYILKMGSPVRILDMATNLILLSGLEPGRDIQIITTGLKQGEKLEEELVEDDLEISSSPHPQIMTLNLASGPEQDIEKKVLDIEILSRGKDTGAMLRKLQELVPSFNPSKSSDTPLRKD